MTSRRVWGLALAALLLLSGCWSSREINQLAIVLSAAVDRAEDGQYVVTALISNPSNPSAQSGGEGGGGGSEGGSGAWIVAARGPTFFEAVSTLAASVPRRLFWPHSETMVLSERLARQGIGDILDGLTRDTEVRRTLYLLVARDELFSVVGATPILEQSLSRQLDGLIQNRIRHSHAAGGDLARYLRSQTADHIAPMTLVLSLRPDPAGGLGLSPADRIEMNGTAVFWQDRLVGYLDKRESMGALLLQGELKGGVFSIPCPGEPERLLTVLVSRGRSKLSTKVQGGRLQGEAALDLDGRVGEVHCTKMAMVPADLDRISRLVETEMKAIAEEALAKAQSELGVDPFGFGAALFRSNPAAWKRISSNWPEPYRTMPIRITAKASLENTGLTDSSNPNRR